MVRTVAKVKPAQQAAADLAYWLSRPMAERLAAVEALRQQAMGALSPGRAEQRLERVWRIAHRARG